MNKNINIVNWEDTIKNNRPQYGGSILHEATIRETTEQRAERERVQAEYARQRAIDEREKEAKENRRNFLRNRLSVIFAVAALVLAGISFVCWATGQIRDEAVAGGNILILIPHVIFFLIIYFIDEPPPFKAMIVPLIIVIIATITIIAMVNFPWVILGVGVGVFSITSWFLVFFNNY